MTAYFKGPLWKRIKADKLKTSNTCCLCQAPAETVYVSRYDEPTLTGTHDKHLYSMCKECHGEVQFEDGERLGIKESNERLFSRLKHLTHV